MIESGELVGEREPLAKGSNRDRYRVRLDAPATPQDAPPSEPTDASEPATTTSDATMRLLDVVLTQADTIADLRERLGKAEARAEMLTDARDQFAIDMGEQMERAIRAEARAAALAADLEQERRRPWWRRLLGRE